jgi:SAM-dependent methyltransferase
MPSPEELDILYRHGAATPDVYPNGAGGMSTRLADSYIENLLTALKRSSFGGAAILDYGAGHGQMTLAAARHGASAVAYDPYWATYLNAHNIPAIANTGVLGDKRFDGVLLMDVVEHLREPWKVLSEVREMLKPGGWVYIATVNTEALRARFRGYRWRNLERTHHIVFPPPALLRAMLLKAGYSRVERLRWKVRYFERDNQFWGGKTRWRTTDVLNQAKNLARDLLSAVGMDGELRMLAWIPKP